MITSNLKVKRRPLQAGPIPRHVAIIMDGNRRWANDRRMPVIEGYRRGIVTLREITKACSDLGVSVLTVYGFSTENWKRDWSEISLLFDLCCAFARSELDALCRDNVRVRIIGRYQALPAAPRAALENLAAKTTNNDGVTLNLAVNYSARAELQDAVRELARDVRNGTLNPDEIDETTLSSYLYTEGLPDPDLLIRPGGEARLSNFLLFQVAYTELWLSDVNWPDFSRAHFEEALRDYQQRQRRFGGV